MIYESRQERPVIGYEELSALRDTMNPSEFINLVFERAKDLLSYDGQEFKRILLEHGISVQDASVTLGMVSASGTPNGLLNRMLSGTRAFALSPRAMRSAHDHYFPSISLDLFLFGEGIPAICTPVDDLCLEVMREFSEYDLVSIKEKIPCAERELTPYARLVQYCREWACNDPIDRRFMSVRRIISFMAQMNTKKDAYPPNLSTGMMFCVAAGIPSDYFYLSDYSLADWHRANADGSTQEITAWERRILSVIAPLNTHEKRQLIHEVFSILDTK